MVQVRQSTTTVAEELTAYAYGCLKTSSASPASSGIFVDDTLALGDHAHEQAVVASIPEEKGPRSRRLCGAGWFVNSFGFGSRTLINGYHAKGGCQRRGETHGDRRGTRNAHVLERVHDDSHDPAAAGGTESLSPRGRHIGAGRQPFRGSCLDRARDATYTARSVPSS
jgi:hypothetical protein